MDRPQPLSDHAKAFDAVFFSGASVGGSNSSEGDFTFVAAMIRRKDKRCDTVLYIKNDLGFFRGTWMPKVGIESADEDGFSSLSGLKLEVLEPMRQWRIEYMGKVKRIGGDEEVNHCQLLLPFFFLIVLTSF